VELCSGGFVEVGLHVDNYEGKVVVGRSSVLWFETFIKNFLSGLGQSISRLTKLIDSRHNKVLGVTSEKSI
jgi:hypothetical protein